MNNSKILQALLNSSPYELAEAFKHLQATLLMDIADLAVAQVNDMRKERSLSAYKLPSYQRPFDANFNYGMND